MDPFTERMLERARARREKLDAQLNNLGQLGDTSRRHKLQDTKADILAQNNGIQNSKDITVEKHEVRTQYKSVETYSSKGYSEKNKENEKEENVRYSVRSRLKRLGAVYSNSQDLDDPGEMPSPSHRAELKCFEEEETPRTAKAPAHAVQRLAALANNINHWEDDLSHPNLTNVKVAPKPESVLSNNSPRPDGFLKQSSGNKPVESTSTSLQKDSLERPQEIKKAAAVVNCSPKNSPQKPPRTPTTPLVWDQAILASLESQGFRHTLSRSRLVYDYANPSPQEQEKGSKEEPEKPASNSDRVVKQPSQPSTPTRMLSPRSGTTGAENGNAAKQLTPRKQNPTVGSVLHRAALFESPTKSPKIMGKDPAELSVAERKALFEKNKGQALIPKAAFSMSVPTKQLATSPHKIIASPSRKPVGMTAHNSGSNVKIMKPAVPEVVNKEVSRVDEKAASSSSSSRVLDARNLFEKGQQQQKRENDILKNVHSERQKEMEMLLNRWNKQKVADSSESLEVSKMPLIAAPTPQDHYKPAQAPLPPPPPPPMPPSNSAYTSPSPCRPLNKHTPLSPQHKTKPSPSHSIDKSSSLVNVRKIKVSPAKPGCLYPNLSDIDATESEMDQEESEGENESFGDLESSSPNDSSSSDASIDAGETSFGREIFQATGIDNSVGKKRGSGRLSKSEEAVFDEMDELLDEALNDEYMMGGPTPPKRRSGESPLSPSKSSGMYQSSNSYSSPTKRYNPVNQYDTMGKSYNPYDSQPNSYRVDYHEEHLPTHVMDGDQQLPLMHSVSFYRKQQAQGSKSNTLRHVVRSPESSGNPCSGDSDNLIHKKDDQAVQKKIKSLLDEVSIQQTIISQASQALNLCSSTIEFCESAEQVEGERLLLVATHRRQAALHEIQRLKVEGTLWPKHSPDADDVGSLEKGDLGISEITLPLKKEFLSRVANGDVDFTHHFVCLIKHQENIICTEMLSTENVNRSRGVLLPSLRFNNNICLSGLYSDFKVTLEVYGLQVRKEVLSHEVKYHIRKDTSKIRLTPKKLLKQESRLIMPVVQSPAGPSAVRSTAFSLAGYVIFSLRELNRIQWTLNKVPYSSPLEGTVHMKLQCHLEQGIEERGFLTMFDDVSGFGAWHRRWCLLQGDKLAYWKYPEDERKKEPIGWINLKACTNQKVGPVPREICARANTFLLETRRPALPEDRDTLVLVTSSTHTTIRHLLSADSKEERQQWCSQVNKALVSLRAWGPK